MIERECKTMKKIVSVPFLLMLVLSMMLTPVYGETSETDADTTSYGDQIEAIINTIMDKYLDRDDITEEQLFEAALKGVFDELDTYSRYIPADNSVHYTNVLNNTYVGIGVQMTIEGDDIVITRVFFDGPAEAAGVLVHDKIIGVEEQSVAGFSTQEVANLILGDEGTDVTITLDRSGYVFDVTMTRGTVVINTVDLLDIQSVAPNMDDVTASKIGYIKIESFTNNVDTELEPILDAFKAEGKTYLLMDLRDNGGGYVDAAVAVCDMLVPEGPVLRFVNNDGREIVYMSNNTEPTFEIVALINGNSASATEFVAAAIQESGRGKLVGETTFGKGVAQYLYNLEDGAIVKLTQEAFYSGDNVAIHGIGVRPDIVVEIPDYLTKQDKFHQGFSYDEVLQLEQILQYIGYSVNTPDRVYDEVTVEAIRRFQSAYDLYAYGIADFTTQDQLNQALIEAVRANDLQLEMGIDTLLEMITERE